MHLESAKDKPHFGELELQNYLLDINKYALNQFAILRPVYEGRSN